MKEELKLRCCTSYIPAIVMRETKYEMYEGITVLRNTDFYG